MAESVNENNNQVPDPLADFLAGLDEKDQAEGVTAENVGRMQTRAVKPTTEAAVKVKESRAVVGASQAKDKFGKPITPKITR